MTVRTCPSGVPNRVDVEQADLEAACRFYSGLFGWTFQDVVLVAGEPAYRVATLGGQDAIAWLGPLESRQAAPHWHVTFTVADRDASVAAAERLGAAILATDDSPWTRDALVRDPQGAEITLSQFAPSAMTDVAQETSA